MKLSTAALAVSLAVNVGLVAFLRLQPAAPSSGDASGLSTAASGANGGSPRAADKNAPTSAPADSRKMWEKLHTDDLAALVARLRAAGFPNDVVRRVIGALVSERFDGRRLEIEKANLESPFWKNTASAFNDPKIGPELRKLQVEQTEVMRQLLGGNLAELFAGSEDERAMLRFQIGDIAPDKLEQLYTAAMAYSDKLTQVYAGANAGGNRNIMLDSDREKLVAADKTYRDDLAKFLTPAEVQDFVMHNSQLAGQVRNILLPMKLSEAEYRAVFPLFQAYQDQNPTMNFTYLPPDASPAARAAVEQLNNQLAATLGPDRAADVQQATNLEYNQLNRLVTRLDLPLSAATQVAAVQKDALSRATALRSDGSLNAEARAAQFAALAQEASGKISAALGGQRGLDAYKDNGGQWLINLVPRPRPAAPPSKG